MYSVYVVVFSSVVYMNVNKTINGEWTFTFHTVKSEVPALTTIQTATYPEVAIVLHFQGCILDVLGKNAVLQAGCKYILI